MVAIDAAATIGWIVFGTVLTFWHRNLMVRLHERSPEVWQRLSDGWAFRQFWHRSLDYPIWSWRSLTFFVLGQYKKLNYLPFTKAADSFRLALIIWLVGLLVPLAFVL
jgi:hypothetical protein